MATHILSIIKTYFPHRRLFWPVLLYLGAYGAAAAPPSWTVDPAAYQFNMNMVIRVSYNNVPANDAAGVVGVFVGPELRGVATPVELGGQMYYFVTIFSNAYFGEMLRFRVYYSPDDKVYATTVSVPFIHHGSTGTIAAPFFLNIDSNIDYAPEILPIAPDTTLVGIPFDPVNLDNYLLSLDGDPVTWSVMAGPNLSAAIVNGVLTVTPVSPAWTGTESIQIKATENTPNQYVAMRTAQFTVIPDYGPPVLQPIPPQTVFTGDDFTDFDLDDYLQFNGPCRAFEFRVFPYSGNVPDPAWPAVPAGPQPMTVVVRPLFADLVLAGPGARLAAFAGNTLLGTATPSGTPPFQYYSMSLQNLASGPLTFRLYDAGRQYLYEKTTNVPFQAGGSLGSAAAPYLLQLAPLVPEIGPNGEVQITVADPAWLGEFPVDFIVKDCNFPQVRRDTSQAIFRVVADERPELTSPPAVSFTENACLQLYDAQSSDPNDGEGAGLTYSLNGGADQTRFSINPANGHLSWFNFSPDFENPADADSDNVYEVTIRVTNTLNLFDELAVSITVTDQSSETFGATINGGAPLVCFSGSAVLQAAGGIAYQWSTGDATTSVTVSMAGVYTVTVTNSLSCTASATITVSPQPSITAGAGNVPVCAGSSIQLTSTPSGVGQNTSFSWSGPQGFSSNLQNPPPFLAFPITSGVYTVTVTNDGGCAATATALVSVTGNLAPSVVATANSPLCAGANLSLQATASGGSGVYSAFRWSGPNGYVSVFQNPLPFTASAASGGVYTVTVTDNAGCTATGTVSVQVKAQPQVSAGNNGPVCIGKNIELNATASGGSGAPYTFAWSGINGYNSTQEDPAAFAALQGSGGAYTVTVTDGEGCTATATTSVTVNGLPSVTASLSGPVCAGGSIGLQSAPSNGTAPYVQFAWSGPGYSSGVEDPPAFPAVPQAGGAYTVTVTDNAGCTGTGSVSVVVNPAPSISAMSNSPVCQGKSLTLTSNPTGGTTPYVLVQWSGPDDYVASTPNPASFTTTLVSAGTYRVTVTDQKGCTAAAATEVMVSPKPSLTASSNTPVCAGANIDLKATPSGGSGTYSTFNWAGPAGYAGAGQNPSIISATIGRSGIYSVTVTDNAGCTATASTTVAVSSFPAPTISAMGSSPVCAGSSITLGSTPSGGLTPYAAFKWSGPNNYSSTQQTPAGFTASTAGAGVYTVTVTDSRGCVGTSSVSVQVSAPAVNPTASSPVCPGSTVFLSANPSGSLGAYQSFSWSGPNGYQATGEHPAGFVADANTAGNYTVTVTDFLNCTGTGTVSVSLEANDPPTITCPTDQTVAAGSNCSAELGNWTPFATNVGDDCTPTGNIAVSQMPLPFTTLSGHNDEETVTLTADDGTGNTASCTFKVTLKDVTPPSITCPPDQTLAADAGCNGLAGAWAQAASGLSDNCTAPASIQVTQTTPANTPLSGHDAAVDITLVADDNHGNTTPCTFKVRLKDITPPSITCPPDQTLAADANCSGVVGARTAMAQVADNCTAPANILITQMPAAGTVLAGHNDEETLTLTADDGNGNQSACSFKVILKDVTPPAITCPVPVLISCAASFPAPDAGQVIALDNCGTPVKSFLYDSSPYDIVCVNRFKVNRYYRAVDAAGNSSTCLQVITVRDETAPNLLFVPANVTVQCNAIPQPGMPSAVDNCTGPVNVTYNGQTVSSVICDDSYTLTRQWTATDICGNTKTATQRITVRDTQRPTFTSAPPNVTVECNAVPPAGTATATDNCDTSVSIAYEGESRTNGACPDSYTLTRRWRATDNCGNTRTVTQRITVRDTQKPAFTSVPQNVTIECSDPLPPVGTVTATDNCDASVSITFLGEVCIFSSKCAQNHEWIRTWRATDNCGNSTTAVQVITVQDIRPPVFTNVPPHVTIQCNDLVPPVGNPTATDNCSAVQITFLGSTSAPGDCPQEYLLTRSWRAQDDCGNSVTASQTITVQDTQAPAFVNPPANTTVTCANIPPVPVMAAQDNCTNAPQLTYLGQTQTPGDCSSGYTLTRTWTAADNCGNTATHTQVITVAPSFVSPPDDRVAPPAETPKDFTLMPNPSSGEVFVDLSDFAGEGVRLALFNSLGALVWEQSWQEAPADLLRLNLLEKKGLQAGIYRVLLESGEGRQVKTLVLLR